MHNLFNNQLVSGGLVLMVTGAVMGLLRHAPEALYDWCKDRWSVSVMIFDTDPLFEWTKVWLDSLPYARRSRRISCSLYREPDEDFSTESRPIFTPNYGNHFFRHRGKFIWLSRDKNEKSAPDSRSSRPAPETMTLTVFGTKQDAVRDLINEIIVCAKDAERRRVRAYISGGGWWRRLSTFQPRAIETVDIPTEDETRIVEAITEFLATRALYIKRGIPYHLNFLFEGLPGTGKTSLASALSGHFGLNLYLLNIAGPDMNDDRLVDLVLSLPRKSMLLLEDVDAVVPERTAKPRPAIQSPVQQVGATPTASGKEESRGITLSGLLNCMDGITAPDGAVIVMTTNHPELLDPALVRDGRVDIRVKFRAATRAQIEKMCRRLNPKLGMNGAVDAMLARQLTTAQVQGELLRPGARVEDAA